MEYSNKVGHVKIEYRYAYCDDSNISTKFGILQKKSILSEIIQSNY
jgi:hypothetical protein